MKVEKKPLYYWRISFCILFLDLNGENKQQPGDSNPRLNGEAENPSAEEKPRSTRWSRVTNCCLCRVMAPYRGILLALLSAVLMTSYTTMIKFLDEMDSMQVGRTLLLH